MDLVRVLNSVGKSTFVKYYYNFRDKSRDECIMLFDEDFTSFRPADRGSRPAAPPWWEREARVLEQARERALPSCGAGCSEL